MELVDIRNNRADPERKDVYSKVPVNDVGCSIEPHSSCGLDVGARTRGQVQRLLYLSHFLAQFSEVSFQFSIAVFLAACNYGDSPMRLVSTYGLALSVAVTVSNGWIGAYIDSTERWATVSRMIVLENGAVLCTTIAAFLLAHLSKFEHTASVPLLAAIVLVHFFGAVAQSLDSALLVAIERDWIVVVASGDVEWLSSTTVTLKQIDLACKVVAPAIMGGLMVAVPLQYGALSVGALNVTALITEYVCTWRIYCIVPELATKRGIGFQAMSLDTEITGDSAQDSTEASSWALRMQTYTKQSSFPAGLGLALLYGNALTFGNGILTAFLLSRGGLSLRTIGIVRGIAAGIGLLGTFAFRASDSVMPLESTGMWSIALQTTCFLVPCLSFWTLDNQSFVIVLLIGICASRIGLWVFDIVVTRFQQQEVPEAVRGVVGGMQQSLNAGFTMLSFAAGVLAPSHFMIFLAVATICVTTACLSFAFGIYFPRKK